MIIFKTLDISNVNVLWEKKNLRLITLLSLKGEIHLPEKILKSVFRNLIH